MPVLYFEKKIKLTCSVFQMHCFSLPRSTRDTEDRRERKRERKRDRQRGRGQGGLA